MIPHEYQSEFLASLNKAISSISAGIFSMWDFAISVRMVCDCARVIAIREHIEVLPKVIISTIPTFDVPPHSNHTEKI